MDLRDLASTSFIVRGIPAIGLILGLGACKDDPVYFYPEEDTGTGGGGSDSGESGDTEVADTSADGDTLPPTDTEDAGDTLIDDRDENQGIDTDDTDAADGDTDDTGEGSGDEDAADGEEGSGEEEEPPFTADEVQDIIARFCALRDSCYALPPGCADEIQLVFDAGAAYGDDCYQAYALRYELLASRECYVAGGLLRLTPVTLDLWGDAVVCTGLGLDDQNMAVDFCEAKSFCTGAPPTDACLVDALQQIYKRGQQERDFQRCMIDIAGCDHGVLDGSYCAG